MRADGAIAFWYKPDSSHSHLYPARKDAAGNPIVATVNGEAQYENCPNGINNVLRQFLDVCPKRMREVCKRCGLLFILANANAFLGTKIVMFTCSSRHCQNFSMRAEDTSKVADSAQIYVYGLVTCMNTLTRSSTEALVGNKLLRRPAQTSREDLEK
eukprot:3167654-Pleurochrysis_carterae.AAC.1